MFRWGVIGTGNIAKIVCDKIEKSKRHKVVAVYSRTQKRAEKFALRYNANCYADKEKFFEDKNIDAIYIATPHSAHYEYLLECINHNIPVLSEKSFTVNEMQAKAVFDLAKQKKSICMRGNVDEISASYRGYKGMDKTKQDRTSQKL